MFDWISIEENNNYYKLTIPKFAVPKLYGIDAAHFNIKYITENYPPPYTLCLSGGVDSQAMLYAWHTSLHKFNTLSVKYNHDMNHHDLRTLEEFSQQNNITINYLNFDVLNFYDTEYEQYVHRYKCGSPHFCVYMKFSEMVNEGTVIFSGTPFKPSSRLLFGPNELGLYRYAKLSGKNFVPSFFLETKEMAHGLLQPSTYSENSLGHIARHKIETYWHNGFPVISQKTKITGFEKIKDYYDIHYRHLVTVQDKLYGGINKSTRTYDQLLRNKYERLYPDKYDIIVRDIL